jgi:hypothetical protein
MKAKRVDDPAEAGVQLPLDPTWDVLPLDPLSGAVLTAEERAYRERIRAEAEQGLIAVDPLYHAHAREIHRSISSERGAGRENGDWELRRPNRTTLRISFGSIGNGNLGTEDGDLQAREDLGVMIARKAIGEVAADLMRLLYTLANDPPNWRSREIRTTLSDIMDRMHYARDERGNHRSGNRRTISQTLLALQFTQIGVQRDEDGVSVGTIGSLISGMQYRTRVPVSDLSPVEVFAAGLPEDIVISLNPQWYRLRDGQGRPVGGYALVPRPMLLLEAGASRGVPRDAFNRLARYIADVRREAMGSIVLTRDALLLQGGITDSRRRQATQTLTKALDRLRSEGVIEEYGPRPLPTAMISLSLSHAG